MPMVRERGPSTMPGRQVGLMEKTIRLLNCSPLVERSKINLAHWLCHPQQTLPKRYSIDFYGYQYQGLTNNRIDWLVYFFHKFIDSEMALIRHIGSLIKRQNRPFVCYDIGASLGHMTLAMASVADKVLAVEPHPEAYTQLRAKLALNRLSHVKCFRLGLGESRTRAMFNMISPINLIAKRADSGCNSLSFSTFDAQIVRGDELIRKNGLAPASFVRVNVDDNALNVLAGLTECLRETSPVVMIERPTSMLPKPLTDMSLRDVLYDDVQIFAFRRTPDRTSFELDNFDPAARQIVCLPAALMRSAEQERAKLRSARLV